MDNSYSDEEYEDEDEHDEYEYDEDEYEYDEDLYDEDLYDEDLYDEPQVNKRSPSIYDEFLDKFTGTGSSAGSKRLMDDLRTINPTDSADLGYSIEIVDDNLYHWQIKLFSFPQDSNLHQDLIQYQNRTGIDHILLDVTFPSQYPFDPPFVRVLYPRFRFMTGHITIGGSICMEVLTKSGWSPGYSIENLIMQIKSEIVDPEGGARIDLNNMEEYSLGEAKEAFNRMVSKYGW